MGFQDTNRSALAATVHTDLSFVAKNAAGWLCFSFVLTTLNHFMHNQPIAKEISPNLGLMICCVLGTMLLRIFIHSAGARASWRSIYIRAFLIGIPVSSLLMAFMGVEYHSLFLEGTKHGPPHTMIQQLLGFWFFMAVLFSGWAGIYISALAVRRSTQAEVDRLESETALREAELKALKAQINPHFLFNSLNTIRALINERPNRAQEAVLHLSLLLRAALQSDLMLRPLRDEMETVGHYLELEKLRFEERIRVLVDITPEALDVLVPTMLVQTLVENAVKHGIANMVQGGELIVDGGIYSNVCVLRISNPGSLGHSTSGTRVGLKNARMRLSRLLGDPAALNIIESSGRVTAELILPLKKQ